MKLAASVKFAGLDARVSQHGNFGESWDDGRRNCRRYLRIAAALGLEATCFLTFGDFPFQPFIGRGESLMELDQVFRDTAGPQLSEHLEVCRRMAQAEV